MRWLGLSVPVRSVRRRGASAGTAARAPGWPGRARRAHIPHAPSPAVAQERYQAQWWMVARSGTRSSEGLNAYNTVVDPMRSLDGYLCPACGYRGLPQPPWKDGLPSDYICPSCGIQFGYDDAACEAPADRASIYKEWRNSWIRGGMRWFSKGRQPPSGWDPEHQLEQLSGSC